MITAAAVRVAAALAAVGPPVRHAVDGRPTTAPTLVVGAPLLHEAVPAGNPGCYADTWRVVVAAVGGRDTHDRAGLYGVADRVVDALRRAGLPVVDARGATWQLADHADPLPAYEITCEITTTSEDLP